MLMVACTPEGASTPIPTLPISPIPATYTPPPATETPTPEPRLSPSDLMTATPQDDSSRLLALIQTDVQMRLDVEELVEDVTITPMRWEDSATLGCESPTVLSANIRRIDGYWVLVTAGERVFDYHTNQEQLLVLCAIYTTRDMPVDVRQLIDPLAVELVALVQRRLANQFDILERRVKPIEITPYQWSDTSLGCPDPNQTYVEQVIEGYRLVMQVGDALYAFHTDSEKIVPCALGQEVLPLESENTPTA